jgi:uncharacterized membrane-anchored protein
MNRRQAIAVWGGLALVLGTVNVSIAPKEWLRAHGRTLLLELGARDQRSLMEGDYMRLNFALTRTLAGKTEARSGTVVVHVDAFGVATFARLAGPGEALGPDEALLRFNEREGQPKVGPDAFHFQEGQAERYARARYGEVRVDTEGVAVLVGLRDEAKRPL